MSGCVASARCTCLPHFPGRSQCDRVGRSHPHTVPRVRCRPTRPTRSASSQPSAPARCPARSVCSEAMFSVLSISEKAPEIASGQIGRVGFRAEPERRFDANRVGRLGRLASPAVGCGFGFACRDVAVVSPGRLRAPEPPSLRTCGGGSRSVVHMHVLRPAAFGERFSGCVSVGPAASVSMCMCGADVGLACQRLARAMQCLRSTCKNAYCMCS